MSLSSVFQNDFTIFERPAQLTQTATGLQIQGQDSSPTLRVTVPFPGVFRLRTGDMPAPDYGILTDVEDVVLNADLQADGTYIFKSAGNELHILSNPVRLQLWQQGQIVLNTLLDEHFRGWSRLPAVGYTKTQWSVAFELDAEEPVYGLGEKFGRLNKRGELVHSYVEDALGVNTELSYKNTPFCWSPKGWGLFFHTPATVVHGVGYGQWSHRAYAAVVDEPRLDLFLIAGQTPADILGSYTRLTGTAPALPLWSYGVWVSRAYYRTGDEIEDAARELREKDFPADVITFDGRAWLDTDTRFNFKWDPARYPNPAENTAKLRDLNFKICNWEYPLVSIHEVDFKEMAEKGWFLKNQQGETYIYHWDTDKKTSPFGNVLTPLPPSGILDFTHPDAYAYWRDMHQILFKAGVDVMKVDFGEQVPFDAVAHNGDSGSRLHSVYPLLYNRCVYEASQAAFGDQACVWARASWAGSQRYPLQWGGDPQSDWGGLSGSIRGGLSWGMSGVPYHATDVGGFYGKEQPSAELYLRWVQYSVFSSHFRIHGIGEREPWCFGPAAEKIARQWFKLRYRLIPYLKAAGDMAATNSLPVMRAMPLAYPEDRLAHIFEHQFMCGDSLLVAPVIQAGHKVDLWLPEGEIWIDLWTAQSYEGGQRLCLNVAEDQIPVFLKSGHVLPLGPVVSHTAEMSESGVITEVIAPSDIRYLPPVYGDQLTLQQGRILGEDGRTIPVTPFLTLPA